MSSLSVPFSKTNELSSNTRSRSPRKDTFHFSALSEADTQAGRKRRKTKSLLTLKVWQPVTGIAAVPLYIFSRLTNAFYWISHPSTAYIDIMYWIMGMKYSGLVLFFASGFYILILFFTLLIYAGGLMNTVCLVGSDGNLKDIITADKDLTDGAIFSIAFALSWTTFSTVGYGNTWPALTPDYCMHLNYVTLATAFVGVCYVGACSALLFGKIIKEQSEARVVFSEACTIRFGSGIEVEEIEDETEHDADAHSKIIKEQIQRPIPCPILEFRVLNKLYNIENGAIADAVITCAAGVEEEKNNMTGQNLGQMDAKDNIVRVSLPKKMFHIMEFVNGSHPYFRRVWTLTHILDENSPLLSSKMRKRIVSNHGFWPQKYNSADAIKQNLAFKEIIISFCGISNHTSSEVRTQKVYNHCDVVVGYEFIRMIEKVGENIKVFPEYLNDVTEQNGADEPIPLFELQRRPGTLLRELSRKLLRVDS